LQKKSGRRNIGHIRGFITHRHGRNCAQAPGRYNIGNNCKIRSNNKQEAHRYNKKEKPTYFERSYTVLYKQSYSCGDYNQKQDRSVLN